MKSVVVTGASGMLGSALVRNCLLQGDKVIAIVRKNSEKLGNLPYPHKNLTIIECDLDEYESIVLPKEHCVADEFFHFAWGGTYGELRNDLEKQLKNVEYTLSAVKLAKRLECKSFVGAGSQAEFGRIEDGSVLSETRVKKPDNAYGVAKSRAAKKALMLTKQNGIKFNWGYVVSAYGVGDNSYTLISTVIDALLKNQDVKLTPGDQIWNYLYCDDVAKAFRSISQKGIDGQDYFIADSNQKKLKTFLTEIKNVIGGEGNLLFGAREYFSNQVMSLIVDTSKLFNETGFIPEIDFKEGIVKTIEWRKKILNIKN